MPTPYSLDLRWRAVWLYTVHHQGTAEVAQQLCLSVRTVRRYVHSFLSCGDVKSKSYHHGPQRLLGEFEQIVLLRLITDNVGIYLHEVQAKLLSLFGVPVSTATVCRTLKYMGCTRQVVQHIAIQRNDELRAKFMAEISVYDPSMLIWIDESGCDRRNCVRKKAYSFRGITHQRHVLLVRGTRYSAIPIMSVEGIHDLYLFEGNVNGARFTEFVSKCLLPILQPFNWMNHHSVVVMDNASIHHVGDVRALIEDQAHARLLFLPPYSPDLNPIEEVFGQVKSIMKGNHSLFQGSCMPRVLLSMAFAMITKEDCYAHVKHCGY